MPCSYAFARTVKDSREYARTRVKETGRPYAVWTASGRPDLWWAAAWCASNDRCYRACGATARTIYRPAK